MGEDSTIDLRVMLKRMGYPERAAKEILKWYEISNLHAEGYGERSLYSNDISRRRYKR